MADDVETIHKSQKDFKVKNSFNGSTEPPEKRQENSTQILTEDPARFEKILSAGTIIVDRYHVIRSLGEGGIGGVYLCRDNLTQHHVVLKTLLPESGSPDEETMQRFQANFSLIHNLHHQHIASCDALVSDDTLHRCFLVMEYVDGEDLKSYFGRHRRNGSFSNELVLKIFRQIAEALDYAHSKEILHRDIKSANIMVVHEDHVKILGFGMTAEMHNSLSMNSSGIHDYRREGTLLYMAPELFEGEKPGKAADQYAMAVAVYEIFSGHHPFSNQEILWQCVTKKNAPVLKNVPDPIQKAVARALSKKPGQRFESCSAFCAAMEEKKRFRQIFSLLLPVLGILLLFVFLRSFKSADKVTGASRGSAVQKESALSADSVQKPEERNDPEIKQNVPEVPSEVSRGKAAVVPKEPNSIPAGGKVNQEELYLRYVLQNLKKKIEKAKYDRGQNFGAHLDEFYENFSAGEAAFRDKNFSAALLLYRKAYQAAEWILKNAPQRRRFWECNAALKEEITKARSLFGTERLTEGYEKILGDYRSAYLLFEKGEFEKAANQLAKVVSAYSNAREAQRRKELAGLKGRVEKKRSPKTCPEIGPGEKKIFVELKRSPDLQTKPTGSSPMKITLNDSSGKSRQEQRKVVAKGKTDARAPLCVFPRSGNIKWGKASCKILLPGKNLIRLQEIKPNSFVMGSPLNELGREQNEKRRRVTLNKIFWIGVFEITQAQWSAVMGQNPSHFQSPDRPVESVSWYQAKKYCEKLNKLYGNELPRGYRFDLPSEIQWEYACRFGTESALNSGDGVGLYGLNNSSQVDRVGWYSGNCGKDFELRTGTDISGWNNMQYRARIGGTHPVGKKQPNNLGLYDMHGNVWEWCRDVYQKYPTGKKSASGHGQYRVFRGGAWNSFASQCRSAKRSFALPGTTRNNLGFRLALVAESGE